MQHLAYLSICIIMPPPLIGGGIKRCFYLTSDVYLSSVWRPSVCLSRTSGLSAALTRTAAGAVSVGTCSAWESTVMLRLLGGARDAWAPTEEEKVGHIVTPRT